MSLIEPEYAPKYIDLYQFFHSEFFRFYFDPLISFVFCGQVPLVKMVDFRTRCQVDISFNNIKGVENSKIVRNYLKKYSPLRPLTIVLKYFLQQRQLNEPYLGGLGSYSLILMIVSLLQVLLLSLSLSLSLSLTKTVSCTEK
jgi:non-canonical poly(A) RNA polymerase PAPD5/7